MQLLLPEFMPNQPQNIRIRVRYFSVKVADWLCSRFEVLAPIFVLILFITCLFPQEYEIRLQYYIDSRKCMYNFALVLFLFTAKHALVICVASNQTFVSNKTFISWTLIDSDK